MWTKSEMTVIDTREGARERGNRRAVLLGNRRRGGKGVCPAPVQKILQPTEKEGKQLD